MISAWQIVIDKLLGWDLLVGVHGSKNTFRLLPDSGLVLINPDRAVRLDVSYFCECQSELASKDNRLGTAKERATKEMIVVQ